jgi:SAM-dependent methyltransferase
MRDDSPLDPTRRFTGRSELYAKYRPGYPEAAVDYIIKRCVLSQQSVVVDVGCGTGISSRLFAARGLRVIGIEPNAEMREVAQAESAGGKEQVTYEQGRAEATGLAPAIADAVLAAQAFHWFETNAALSEFHRLLRPDGWAVLMWNERDESDEFTAAYGAVIRTAKGAVAIEGARQRQAGKALLTSSLFREAEKVTFSNEQVLDEAGLLGRAFSASYAPAQADEAARWSEDIKSVFKQFQSDGKASLRYETTVYLACRNTRD